MRSGLCFPFVIQSKKSIESVLTVNGKRSGEKGRKVSKVATFGRERTNKGQNVNSKHNQEQRKRKEAGKDAGQ
jgi:hypothetical protein